jgi:AcrR family transcriptional regulator
MTVDSRVDEAQAELLRYVPEGLDPPADVPGEVFRAALDSVLAGRRLEMGRLAQEIGTSRATLYRRVSDRDQLLGEVVWYLVRFSVAATLERTAHLSGLERVVETARVFLADVTAPVPAFRRLFDDEPVASMRILTSSTGRVHLGVLDVFARLLEDEVTDAGLELAMPARQLAFAVLRLAQSFIYADVIARDPMDVDLVTELVDGLLHANVRPSDRREHP